jgi:hypothetical protein
MARQRPRDDMVMGFAWFDKAQWQRLREGAGDPEIFDDSFEEWERNASRALRDLQRKGQRVEKVHINVEELVSWCKSRGVPVVSKHRAGYVISVLRKRHGRSEA